MITKTASYKQGTEDPSQLACLDYGMDAGVYTGHVGTLKHINIHNSVLST